MRPRPARRDPEDMSQAAGGSQSAAVDQQAPGPTGTYLTSNSLLTSARALTSGPGDSKSVVSSRDFQPPERASASGRSASHRGMNMRYTRLAVFGAVVLVGSLLLSFWVTGSRPGPAAPFYSSVRLVQDRPGSDSTLLAAADTLRSCETYIEATARRAPVAAIVGASFTAGVGPG